MNILLAADGSEYTKRAAKYVAGHIAALAKAPKVFVLNVHPPLPYPGAASVVGRKAVESYQREECEKALKVAEKELDKAGISYKSAWAVGEVAQAVKEHAKKVGADLIVVGSHGHGAFMSMALGSTAAKILAAVKLPLLIVR